MSGDKRITRKQVKEDPELRKEYEAFYTEPFTSTPIPRNKSDENITFSSIEPKALFSGEASSNLSSSSSIESTSANQTIRPEETLKIQTLSDSQSSTGSSDDEKKEKSSIKSPADISGLFEKIEQEDRSSTPSESSVENIKMATKQTISLKDALRVIPEFNGSNISLSQFLEGCDIAKEMIEEEDEKTFVKLLRSKITGEARQVIINTSFDTIENVKDHLKSIYRPSKSVHELLGELGNEFQREDESVVTYANRMRDLGNQIIEASKIANGSLKPGVKDSTFASVVECFKRGLKPEIEQRIKQEASIDVIMKDAIRIERLLEAQKNLRRSARSTIDNKPTTRRQVHYCIECQMTGHNSNDCRKTKHCDFCKRSGHSTEQCFKKNNPNFNLTNFNDNSRASTCQLCNKIGHTADKCYQLLNTKPTTSPNQTDTTERPSCQYCKKIGHTADKCYLLKGSQNQTNSGAQLICQICNKNGHTATTCRSASQNQTSTNSITCSYCKNPGHTIQECRKREYNNTQKSGNEQGPQQSSVGRGTSTTTTRSMNATQVDDLLRELIPLN